MSDLNAKRSALSAQEANVRRLQQLQGFEKIHAPFDGVITARNADIGNLIQAGENTTPQELFHLRAINRLRIFVPVPEVYQSVLSSVKRGTARLRRGWTVAFRIIIWRGVSAIFAITIPETVLIAFEEA